ncbi:lysophospholipid acyltransferase family protein [Phenylobacterium sp.]|uniref:lysophospholipid acyltransferase family protein n=1 Tax=Phenylobacterium sp. TaxID=1871053 RepID=UPI002E30A57E|nr:lysophospholipid acyltransferase family protein [Phenylobacterium sp.]HEX3366884.1 lysophospholipid acyltransferase family protein [Phenylobacterium sp.]
MLLVRSLLFTALFYLWSVFWVLLIVPLVVFPRIWMIRSWKIWSLGVMLLLRVVCNIRVEFRGQQYIPRGHALIAPKHQCMFDVFAQFVVLPNSCFVTKQELMWIPFFGWYAAKGRMIVVDRAGQAAALRKMVADAKDRFADGRQLVIFPEGHRGEPGVAGDYKPGIAALYRELEVAVTPMATNAGVHWPAHGVLRHPGVIVYEYLEPIPPGLKRAEFMRVLQDRIETASNKLLTL